MESIKAFIKQWEEFHSLNSKMAVDLGRTYYSASSFEKLKKYAEEMLEFGEKVGVEFLSKDTNGKYIVSLIEEKFFELVDDSEISYAFTEFSDVCDVVYIRYEAEKNGMRFETLIISFRNKKYSEAI